MVEILPRLQKERWSLYWKESMSTETKCLESITLETQPGATGQDLLRDTAKKLGWPPSSQLLKLDGFKGPWERVLVAGREIGMDETLEAASVTDGAKLTVVRVELIAEGWKISQEDDLLSSSSDEDDDGVEDTV